MESRHASARVLLLGRVQGTRNQEAGDSSSSLGLSPTCLISGPFKKGGFGAREGVAGFAESKEAGVHSQERSYKGHTALGSQLGLQFMSPLWVLLAGPPCLSAPAVSMCLLEWLMGLCVCVCVCVCV